MISLDVLNFSFLWAQGQKPDENGDMSWKQRFDHHLHIENTCGLKNFSIPDGEVIAGREEAFAWGRKERGGT